MDKHQILRSLIPLVIAAFVMILRWRSIKTPVPLHPQRMWLGPVVLAALVGFALYVVPPGGQGWAVFALGIVLGLAVGWQRGRMMRMEVDPGSGQIMVRQSPAAFLFILALFFLKRLFLPQGGGQPSGAYAGPPALPLFTDALLGFALGMVIGMRLEMWRRAVALSANR
ncbi:CcdC protein domain-containing protein [Novosphingobium sp. TH158]|uniref:CcdC protein domain-containing protein n=1 Tax=Novosphingobium sp. TH158 TaxID=2067455 RepID=UPI000C7AC424|nr:CcdC protein domain-containing protein [Novosphingobium sp. TH158]PLK25592.1 DUF1453 domain-containing protein [Novosphingobium sp. TH158]